ncbi:GntR family transcriptional regulator [Atopobacter phocae]|uniref:GntR family transcriptional regulator n=1 Tax=Atopobacter phocae TaxID=136492 RepID=UPI00046FC4A7|nr:GntR family transcriptional regulator [Atopobacter phocae]
MTRTFNTKSLYAQLSERLIDYIEKHAEPNDKMPSERDICQQYHVSRTTVRAAFNELESLGYIYRKPGRGTYVSGLWKERQNLLDSCSFTEQMFQLGKEPKSIILLFKKMSAPTYLAEHLRIKDGDLVYKIKRLRLGNDLPMMLETTYLPVDLFEDLTEEELDNQSLYIIFKEKYKQTIQYADEEFSAGIVDSEEASILEVNAGSPCLRLQRQTFNLSNEVMEYTLSIARSDQFIYRVRYHQEIHNI